MFYPQSRQTLLSATDGTSNTLMVSEVLLSPDVTKHDVRGRIWNNARTGGVLFSTFGTPHSSVPDRLTHCQSIPHAPSTVGSDNMFLPARSRHSGGVNVVLLDGSVRLVSDTIDPTVWLGLGTRAGDETTPNF